MQHKKTKPKNSKRFGTHHRATKKYHSTYWPYIPVIILIAMAFFISIVRSPVATNVLAFATEISSQKLLESTNASRLERGAEPLELNNQLRFAAQAKAEHMAKNNYWSHATPDGQQPWVFIDETQYSYVKAGENLAYGFLTSEQTINGWMNSQSHRENMLDKSFLHVGFGFANATGYQGSDTETIVVAMYAQPYYSSESSVALNESSNTDPADMEVLVPTISMTVPDNSENVKAITRIESLVGDRFSWSTFALGIVSATATMGIVASHGMRLKKAFRRGEDFILHHPMLDVCLVSLLLLTAFLADHVGYII
ncbi:hypothetical protein BH23PAT2_BH23PAT2_00320 [soil metagenome]